MPVCLSWFPEPPSNSNSNPSSYHIAQVPAPVAVCRAKMFPKSARGSFSARERSQATNYRAEETRSSGLGPRVGKKGGRVGHHQQTAARTCNIYGGLAGVLSAKFNFHSCRVRSLSRVAQKFTFTRVGRALFLAWPEAVWEIKFGWRWRSLVKFREVWFETVWGIFNAIEVTDRNGLKKCNLKIWTSLTLLLKEILSTKL